MAAGPRAVLHTRACAHTCKLTEHQYDPEGCKPPLPTRNGDGIDVAFVKSGAQYATTSMDFHAANNGVQVTHRA